MNQQKNVQIFQDTMDLINTDPALRESTETAKKNTFLYAHNPEIIQRTRPSAHAAKKSVTKERTIECALRLSKETSGRTAALNFASPKHPGGGVANGASAQEEAICRITNLYPCLCAMRDKNIFYDTKQKSPYTDKVLYSRDITVIKSDEDEPVLLAENERIKIDIVTCAAPNQSGQKIPENELYKIIEKRIMGVLDACIENGAVNIVLGAWGCGAFRNPPQVVINAMMSAIAHNYNFAFDNIVFAVFARKHEQINYEVFEETFRLWYYP